MPKNIDCITIIITLEGTEKIKAEKKKSLKNYFFHQRRNKTVTNTLMAS